MDCPICNAKMHSFNWTRTGKFWICPVAQAEREAYNPNPTHNRMTWNESELRDTALPASAPVKRGGCGWK